VNWAKGAAYLALGTGLALTLCLALALAALDFRLFSPRPQDFPPGLPGLILALALAAGSFLFLGRRLSRGRKVRLAAYQSTLGLVALSLVVLARQTVRLLGADWPLSGSVLLGMNGLVMGAVGLLVAPGTREALVESDRPEREDLRAEVETLVAEIQETYRRLPAAPPSLTTWQLLREGFLRPARAFQELRLRPHPELCWIVPLMALIWPRLTSFAGRDETAATLLLAGLDYGLWVALYDVGKAVMFWGIARAMGRSLGFLSALTAFMIIDFPSFTSYIVDHLWHDQYVSIGGGWYSQLGLAPFVTGLATTHPALFDILAKVDLLHIWTFLLWWLAIGALMGVGRWVALLLTLVTFPGAHVFAWAARACVNVVRWQ